MSGILSGLKVIELGQVLAGPFAGAIFADLGAEVIKVEKPDGGDDGRRMGHAFRDDASMTFHEFNRNKRSITLDLKSDADKDKLFGLLPQTDILLHNLRPGVAEQLGIGAEAMTARFPRLIYCEMSAFGHRGPLRLKPGYEPLLQAYSGLSSINGDPDGPPVRIGASVVDQGTGMWTVIGALAALQRRQQTGRGGIVNTSLLETALAWAGQKIHGYVNEGKLPERHASGHPSLVPYEAFDAADGPFLIAAGNDRLFRRLVQEIGQPDWAEDARFRSNRDRLHNKAALLALLRPVLARQSKAHWLDRLERAGVPVAPINSIPQVLAEPQTAALEILRQVGDADFKLVALPVSFDGERPDVRRAAPRLGQHNKDYFG